MGAFTDFSLVINEFVQFINFTILERDVHVALSHQTLRKTIKINRLVCWITIQRPCFQVPAKEINSSGFLFQQLQPTSTKHC